MHKSKAKAIAIAQAEKKNTYFFISSMLALATMLSLFVA